MRKGIVALCVFCLLLTSAFAMGERPPEPEKESEQIEEYQTAPAEEEYKYEKIETQEETATPESETEDYYYEEEVPQEETYEIE